MVNYKYYYVSFTLYFNHVPMTNIMSPLNSRVGTKAFEVYSHLTWEKAIIIIIIVIKEFD